MIVLHVTGTPAPKGSARVTKGRGLMAQAQRVTNEQIVEAYRRTGSVWKAGQDLGLVGQSVWERLRAIGHRLAGQAWAEDELAELRSLAGTITIGEIANRLGRPYAGVACKLSELGVRALSPRERKPPRGAGFTKVKMLKLMKEAEASPLPITKFCRQRKISVDAFVLAAQKYFAPRWALYAAGRSPIPQRACDYCGAVYVPMGGKQRACSRKCQTDMRVDRSYFGGKRRSTIGLAERVCQLCGKQNPKGLSSHHMIGKENDPENELLIALCRGCHQVVGMLGRMKFTETAQGWENLISLAAIRRAGDQKTDAASVHVCVDIEWSTVDEIDGASPGQEGATITITEAA